MVPPKTEVVIGIAGPSGAGKSRLAQLLHEQLSSQHSRHDVAILNEDAYYKDRSDLNFQQRCLINYDHPDSLEHDLLARHLVQLRAGQPIQAPQYDYALHNRKPDAVAFSPARVVILEGILMLSDPALCQHLDIKVFVEAPLDICLLRRLSRDTRERERTLESVLRQYETTVRPMYFEFVAPSKGLADLIVPSVGENSNAVDVLCRYLNSFLNDDHA
ncbi:MAG: uridine kinase [Planctomycetota bacterium]